MIWLEIIKSFVIKNLIPIIIVLGIGAAYGYVQYLQNKIDRQQQQIDNLESEVKDKKDTIIKLSSGLADVSKSLDKWSGSASKQQEKFDKLNTSIADMRTGLSGEIANVFSGQLPKSCEESMKYLIDAKGDAKWSQK